MLTIFVIENDNLLQLQSITTRKRYKITAN